ncbi:uncharacterized protein PgNI_04841 [Pyricularia grisea]|uniref:Uncharacterized protein n=1 Tax=Pyricularia grisea TaxID=148305 RepID=A0A6P8BE98_PYRGI|nr:uncharacterized protein PgNI_04841 [Pyricularia grisea]TLD14148.1 hypothetical protein PgNI_04841 [Pyricularia grisea]
MQFPSALIFGLLLQSAVAEPVRAAQPQGSCPAGQTPRINGRCPTGAFDSGGVRCPTGSVPPQNGQCPSSYQPCNPGYLAKRDDGTAHSLVPRDGGVIAALGCVIVSAWCCMLCCCRPPKDEKGKKKDRYNSGFMDGWIASNIASDI